MAGGADKLARRGAAMELGLDDGTRNRLVPGSRAQGWALLTRVEVAAPWGVGVRCLVGTAPGCFGRWCVGWVRVSYIYIYIF